MSDPAVVVFAGCRLDRARFELRRDGQLVHVEPRVLDLLCYLIDHRSRVVPKNELLDEIWGDRFVSDAALTGCMRDVRRAVGDSGVAQSVIRTLARRGYQFVAEVLDDSSGQPAPTSERGGSAHPGGRSQSSSAGPGGRVTTPHEDDGHGHFGQIEAVREGGGRDQRRGIPGRVAPRSVDQSPGESDVERPADPTAADPDQPRPAQQVRFVTGHDGVRIAYATVGEGPPLLKAANWLSHLDREWSSPLWAHWVRDLARSHALWRYDERGCGLSQWDVGEFGFDDWVADLATVADASGLKQFPLLGVSQGAAVAIGYAVAHPERVSHLVLAGGYARGRLVRAQTEEQRRAALLDLELARVGMAADDPSFLQVFAAQLLPDATREDWLAFVDYLRHTTSAANVVRFLQVFAQIDVVDLAKQVRAPTLIVHARDDARVPSSCAVELAGLIPDSRLVLLEGRNHLLGVGDPSWADFLRQVTDFVASGARRGDRVAAETETGGRESGGPESGGPQTPVAETGGSGGGRAAELDR